MNFSRALELLRSGRRMTNTDSMPKGFIAYHKGFPMGIAINRAMSEATRQEEKRICRFRPYIVQQMRDGSFMPWSPTVPEILSHSWKLYEDAE